MKIFFFLGKGGVGKSTLASLTALYLARQNKKVLLTSLDPAHNLTDIFAKKFSDKPLKVKPGLNIVEMDQDKWIRDFLKQSENQLKTTYAYLTTFSMEKHFSVMRHAPALEEYALHRAFNALIEANSHTDIFIFDMPPTALALKFFALAQLSLIWLENLLSLRSEIIKKQEIISKLSLGKRTFERDRVMQNINNQQLYWQKIDHWLKNPGVSCPVLVENPERLSMAESGRIMEKMKNMGIEHCVRALNKAASGPTAGYQLVVHKKDDMLGLTRLEEMVESIDFSKLP